MDVGEGMDAGGGMDVGGGMDGGGSTGAAGSIGVGERTGAGGLTCVDAGDALIAGGAPADRADAGVKPGKVLSSAGGNNSSAGGYAWVGTDGNELAAGAGGAPRLVSRNSTAGNGGRSRSPTAS